MNGFTGRTEDARLLTGSGHYSSARSLPGQLLENVEEGATVAKQIDDVTGLSTLVVIDAKRRTTAASKGQRPSVVYRYFGSSGFCVGRFPEMV